jgi:hypothetical protein
MSEHAEKRPVRVADLANKIGKNPGIVKRMLDSRSIAAFKLKEGQNTPWFVSLDDAQRFETLLSNEADGVYYRPADKKQDERSLSGVYLIEVPSFGNQTRLKIGWSEKISDRIATYRTIVPDLRIIAIWYTNKSHNEQVALDIARNHLMAGSGGNQVFQELFEFADQQVVVNRIKDVFLAMGLSSMKDES